MEERQDMQKALQRFDSVWRRVRSEDGAEETPRGETDEDIMLSLINAEASAAAYDMRLARSTQGAARRTLMKSASDARSRANRLLAEHYIRTGENHRPHTGGAAPTGGMLASLRGAYERDTDTAARYVKAASATADPALRALYTELAAANDAAAGSKRSLIIRTFS